jgi:iron-sulfur cluster assembly accessory protein
MSIIDITENALKHFAKKLTAQEFVLMSTKKSGCSGLSYVTEIKTGEPPSSALKVSADLPIYIEEQSIFYLQGMLVDYQTQGLQSKLVYINPNETGRCGCGTSFSVE